MPQSAPRLEVFRAEDRHAELLAEFIRQVWDPAATSASVQAARAAGAEHNVAEPGIAPPTWIAVQGDKVLGYVTTIPIRFWDGSRDWPAYWIKGLMVLPEFRGGPVGYLVLKAASASLSRTGGLAVAAPARRLFEALGYRDLGLVSNWVRPLAPQNILNRIDVAELGLPRLHAWAERGLRIARGTGLASVGGRAAGVALRIMAAVRRIPSRGLKTGPFDPSFAATELDALWLASRAGFRSAVVRNAPYLIQRYPADAGDYLWLAARHRGALAGVVVLRRPRADGDERLKGIRVATIADLLYPPDRPAAGLALLGAAEHAARKLGADVLLAMSSARLLRPLLRSQGYLPLSGNVHFMFRDVAGDGPAFGPALSDWWITRGDGQTDEAF